MVFFMLGVLVPGFIALICALSILSGNRKRVGEGDHGHAAH